MLITLIELTRGNSGFILASIIAVMIARTVDNKADDNRTMIDSLVQALSDPDALLPLPGNIVQKIYNNVKREESILDKLL